MWKLYTQRKVIRYTEYSEYLEYFASLYVRGVPGSDTSSVEYTYSIATCTSIGSISIATSLSLLGPTVISMFKRRSSRDNLFPTGHSTLWFLFLLS